MVDPRRVFLVALAFAGACSAQVTLTMVALTPVSVSAVTPNGVVSQSAAAGPLAPALQLQTSSTAIGNFASYNHLALVDQTEVSVQFDHTLLATFPSPTPLASAGLHVILMELQSPVPVPVRAEFDFLHQSPPGAPFPLVEVDVADDGSLEFSNGVGGGTGQWVVGPAPLRVRVALSSELGVPGQSWFSLGVRLLPDTNTVVQPAAIGCYSTNPPLSIEPSFVDTGIEVFAPTFASLPGILVFGATPAPVLLPVSVGPACLLYPSVDVTILATSAPQHIALPASVRPATIWCQCVYVDLSSLELYTSDAFRVDAI